MEDRKIHLRLILIFLVVTFFFDHGICLAQNNEAAKVRDATQVLHEIMDSVEEHLSLSFLDETEGVMVIPDILKVGYILGGRQGKGIFVVKQDDGSWSNPVFVELRAGSLGWQIGVQSTDLILFFQSRESVRAVLDGEFTLGADASIAAGPMGGGVGAGTDPGLEAEIYSYSRNRGLFVGISMEGASLQVDHSATTLFYDTLDVGVEQVLWENVQSPPAAREFLETLSGLTESPHLTTD